MKVKKTGFTLVELLVVISIIALLLAVLVPAMKRAKDIAKRVVCSSQLKQIGVGMRAYASSFDNQLPADYVYNKDTGEKIKETHPYVVYRGDADKNGGAWIKGTTTDGKIIPWPLRLAWLYEKKFIGEPKAFYCAGNVDRLYRYESYINPSPWGSLPQEANYRKPRGFAGANSDENQWVRCGYTYFPTDPKGPKDTSKILGGGNNPIYAPKEATEKFDSLDNSLPYMADSLNSRSGLAHKSKIQWDSSNKVTLTNAGVNALYKDGHVVFATNPAIFTDSIWTEWGDTQEGGDIPRTISTNQSNQFYYKMLLLIANNRNLSGSTGRRN